jgi:probable phosphoglycerate mutase
MDGKIHDKFPGGESPVEVNERQVIALNKILSERDQFQNVLICMHGRALRLLLCHMLQLPLNNMDTFPHSNVSLYRLKYINGIFEMLDFNNTDHFHA